MYWWGQWDVIYPIRRQLGLFFFIVSFQINLRIVSLFSTVFFHMCPQIACLKGCKITLITFVLLFSTVHFQMRLQSTCIRGCIFALVAFVWLFSTVYLQICPQIACIVRLIAFVWLFVSVINSYIHHCSLLQTEPHILNYLWIRNWSPPFPYQIVSPTESAPCHWEHWDRVSLRDPIPQHRQRHPAELHQVCE